MMSKNGKVLVLKVFNVILRERLEVLLLHRLFVLEELIGPTIVSERDDDLKEHRCTQSESF
jgi:hypothetical protein